MKVNIIRRFTSKQRRILLALTDLLILFGIFFIFKDNLFQIPDKNLNIHSQFYLFIFPAFGVIIYAITGQYRSLTRYATKPQ